MLFGIGHLVWFLVVHFVACNMSLNCIWLLASGHFVLQHLVQQGSSMGTGHVLPIQYEEQTTESSCVHPNLPPCICNIYLLYTNIWHF